MIRIKKQFAATPDEAIDDDIRRFRHVISYIYAYSEGYVRTLKRSPAFRAVASCVSARIRPIDHRDSYQISKMTSVRSQRAFA